MKILIVAGGAKIPALKYGGTERVIWYLGKELVKLGHQVTYLAAKGSFCDFARVIYFEKNKSIFAQIPPEIEFVHFNEQLENLVEHSPVPYLVTIHGYASKKETLFDQNSVFVSRKHAQLHAAESFVYNGLDWSDYSKPDLLARENYFHFLGKASWPVKNVEGAIELIKDNKFQQLKVIGGSRFNFNRKIRLTFSRKVQFYGMLGGRAKDELLKYSKGLIFPVRWPEPFGLAIIESLYFGAPVFATPYGSLTEIIKSKEYGFLSYKKAELKQALLEAESYSPQICHEYARENFNSKKMALAYLEKYQLVLRKEKLNQKKPQLKEIPKENLLDWV